MLEKQEWQIRLSLAKRIKAFLQNNTNLERKKSIFKLSRTLNANLHETYEFYSVEEEVKNVIFCAYN